MIDVDPTAKIYPNVRLGNGVRIGPWVIIGLPPDGIAAGEFETVIGDGSIIRSHSIIYAGSKIGPGFQTGHHAILGPGLAVGTRCSIGTNSIATGFAMLRDGARIHGHDYVGEFACVNEKAWIGPYNTIESDIHNVSVIGKGAILSMYVHIAPGVRVGDRALVGMRSMLRQDVPPYRVLVGNPPRGVRTIDQILSPIAGIGRPYTPDPPDVQAATLARHASRSDCYVDDSDWRVEMWRCVRAARHSLPASTERASVRSMEAAGKDCTL